MALDSIIRSAVKIGNKLSKPVQETVQHVTWTGQNVSGDAITVTVPRKAIVEIKQHQRRLTDGTVIDVRATLTFLDVIPSNGAAGRVEPIDNRDRFVLADGSNAPILDIEGMRDPGAGCPFFLQVFLGGSGIR